MSSWLFFYGICSFLCSKFYTECLNFRSLASSHELAYLAGCYSIQVRDSSFCVCVCMCVYIEFSYLTRNDQIRKVKMTYGFFKIMEFYIDLVITLLLIMHEVSKERNSYFLTLFSFIDSSNVHNFRHYLTPFLIDMCPDS